MVVHYSNPRWWQFAACGVGVPRRKSYAPIHAAGHATQVTKMRHEVTCKRCLAAMAKRQDDNPIDWEV